MARAAWPCASSARPPHDSEGQGRQWVRQGGSSSCNDRAKRPWPGDDRKRPLTDPGALQAEEVVPLLGAYGVSRVVSSSSRRCWTTVAPYADVIGTEVEVHDVLSEEDATEVGVTDLVLGLLDTKEPTVVCTHRPVIPLVLAAVGASDPKLSPAGMLVVHHRRGQVIAVEHHAPHEPLQA